LTASADRTLPRIRRLAARRSVHVACAVVVMGSWAAFANRTHGAAAMLHAAATQGVASALVTFGLDTALAAMARRCRGVAAFVVPPVVASSAVLALLVAVHRVAGTRELWSTIAIPFGASTAYAWVSAALRARRGLAEAGKHRS
jgi:hypothetical protein